MINSSTAALIACAIISVAKATLPPQPILPPSSSVNLAVGGGWHQFEFGGPHTSVPKHFLVNLHHSAALRVTDFWCTGDRFDVFDNGSFLGRTSHSRYDRCYTNTTNIDEAFADPRWSSGEFVLAPGAHNISLRVDDSPFFTGMGAVRLEPVSFTKCCKQYKGFTVISTPLPYWSAEGACKAHGLHLADIDIFNFLDATQIAFGCSGSFSHTWINSYNGDNYNGTCLTLDTGSAAPGGAVTVPNSCCNKYPVLCMDHKVYEHRGCGSKHGHGHGFGCDRCEHDGHDHRYY